MSSLLQLVNSPHELRQLALEQLPILASEIRQQIIEVVAKNAGHLGASLGAVELAIALHYVFNTPEDRLVWDVGHQAYAHKIITGRRESFVTLRQWGGLSGFPSRDESAFDAFGTGHASTALSATVGMAVAAMLQQNRERQHIAVVGDGAITGGMFFEALNQAGGIKPNLLIVLNDNNISIDKTSGALHDYLLKVRQGHFNNRHPLCEAFGVQYLGIADGHDLPQLLKVLQMAKSKSALRLLHVHTTKGKGFGRAELEQVVYHSPGRFDPDTGKLYSSSNEKTLLWQHVLGKSLADMASQDQRVVVITPAMPSGSSVNMVAEVAPDRMFDVDIAEQHAFTFAAGLAAENMIPFCVVYSTFMQRALDQLIHDIALQRLPVVICIDRAGLVGEDGATHQGAFDIVLMRSVPKLVMAAPMDAQSLRNLLYTAKEYRSGPFAIRYPRGAVRAMDWQSPALIMPIGKGRKLQDGEKTAILSYGQAGERVQDALQKLAESHFYPAHYDLIFARPLDEDLLKEVFENFDHIVTVEDGMVSGGIGSAVLEWSNLHGYTKRLLRLGIPDTFVPHGSVEEQLRICGLDVDGIVKSVSGFGFDGLGLRVN